MPQQPLDVVAFAVAMFSLLFGGAVSEALGPYAVIIVAATAGGAMALAERPPASRMRGLVYLAVNVVVAVLLTVPLAAGAAVAIAGVAQSWGMPWLHALSAQVLLAPIALGIGWVGDRWPRVLRAAVDAAVAAAQRRRGQRIDGGRDGD